MKDFLGKELSVGDTVVFSIPHYHGLAQGHIVKFAPKMVVLDVANGYGHEIVPIAEAPCYAKAITRYPEDCIKVVEIA